MPSTFDRLFARFTTVQREESRPRTIEKSDSNARIPVPDKPIAKRRTSVRKRFGLMSALALLIGAGQAQAQNVFSVTTQSGPLTQNDPTIGDTGTGSGTLDLGSDGNIDANWSLSVTAKDSFGDTSPAMFDQFALSPGPFVGALLEVDLANENNSNGGINRRYDIDGTFTITPNIPGVTFRPTMRGSLSNAGTTTSPFPAGEGFQNNANRYELSWINGSGNNADFVVIDAPNLNQLSNPTQVGNSVSFTQNNNAGGGLIYLPNNTTRGNGPWRNACIAWEVGTPPGFETLVLNVDELDNIEGFGFGVISQTDVAVAKTASATEYAIGESGSYTVIVSNDGSVANGDSAATNLRWSDVLPAGLNLTTATAVIARNNADGNPLSVTTSDIDFDNTALNVDTANDTVSFNGVNLQVGDSITLTINFTVDTSAPLGSITNSASIISLDQDDTDPTNNSDSATSTIQLQFPLPTEVAPQVCAIEPSTAFFNRGADWNSNNTGSPSVPNLVDGSIFSSADPFVAGPGITFSAGSSAIIINGADRANFADAYAAGDFLDYTVQTIAGLSNSHVVSGFAENSGSVNSYPDYKVDILLSDDNFATAIRLVTGYDTDGGFDFIQDIEQQYLDAGTQYTFRVVFYDVPGSSDILWDDFSVSIDQCADRGDAVFPIASANGGAHLLPSCLLYTSPSPRDRG